MEPEAVRSRVSEFAHRYPALSAKQTQFPSMLQNHIAQYGAIELDRLWERPFTLVDPAGVDGVFTNEQQIPDLLGFIGSFRRAGAQRAESSEQRRVGTDWASTGQTRLSPDY